MGESSHRLGAEAWVKFPNEQIRKNVPHRLKKWGDLRIYFPTWQLLY